MNQKKIISLVLMAGGVVLLILGIYQFAEFRGSAGARAASKIGQLFGESSQAVKPILLAVSGVVAGGAGFFLNKKS